MGFLDTLLGRSKAVPPNLDQLFALPAAAVTLQAASELRPTGIGSVSFKAAEGAPFAGMRAEVEQLLALEAASTPSSWTTTGSPGWCAAPTRRTWSHWSPICTP